MQNGFEAKAMCGTRLSQDLLVVSWDVVHGLFSVHMMGVLGILRCAQFVMCRGRVLFMGAENIQMCAGRWGGGNGELDGVMTMNGVGYWWRID